jgi:hypothetical protein
VEIWKKNIRKTVVKKTKGFFDKVCMYELKYGELPHGLNRLKGWGNGKNNIRMKIMCAKFCGIDK